MFQLEKLIRPNILALKPYSNARDEFKGKDGIFLDANENPFGHLNRYPDPHQKAVKSKLAELRNIPMENIFIGNGSDEVIDLALRIFCIPGKDKVIICPPTYGMYEVLAHINDVTVVSIPLNDAFQLNVGNILDEEAKMIFLCSPNNPTANTLEHLETILQEFKGIVFVDEAYIDFSQQASLLHQVNDYPNLIVSQTLSKAWGRAGIRIGIAYASREMISFYDKVKPPYNVSLINQHEAIKALDDLEAYNTNKNTIVSQRAWLLEQLTKFGFVEKVYPSDSNFVWVKTKNANAIYQKLIEAKIVIRNRHSIVENCIRITVGTPAENAMLIGAMKHIDDFQMESFL